MATTHDSNAATLSGLLRRVYKGFSSVVPDNAVLLKEFGFEEVGGDDYREHIALAVSQGFTYAGKGSGAFALNDPRAGNVSQAVVDYYQIMGQDYISFDIVSRTLNAPNEAAVKDSMKVVVDGLMLSLRKRQEINALYGGTSIATATTSTSTTVIYVSSATWAPWIWAGSEGMELDIYVGSTFRGRTAVSSVDPSAKTVTVSPAVTGMTSGDVVYVAGTYGNEALGVNQILTTSGTVFGISNSTYSQWKGNSYAVGGALTQDKVDEAVSQIVDKGFINQEMILCVNPRVWSELNQEQFSRMRFNDGKQADSLTAGTNQIVYKSQGNATIRIVSNGFVKLGEGYLLTPKNWKRLGPVDARLGGPKGEPEVQRLVNNAGYQIAAYSNSATFTNKPASNCVLTGITVS